MNELFLNMHIRCNICKQQKIIQILWEVRVELKNNIAVLLKTLNDERDNQENEEISERFVFSNALSSAQKLRQVEDIRAIFEILGIGS